MRPTNVDVLSYVLIVVLGFVNAAAGARAWWITPPLAFATILLLFRLDGRRPITARWVLLAAAVAVVLGVFLKLY